VIAHPFQLYGGSHQVELVQTDEMAFEGFLGARLKPLAHKGGWGFRKMVHFTNLIKSFGKGTQKCAFLRNFAHK
jgi:hypothetical protein